MNFRPPLPLNPPTMSSLFSSIPLQLQNQMNQLAPALPVSPIPTPIERKKKPVVLEEDQELIPSEEGFLIYNPYNSLNIKITKEEIEGILSTYGIGLPIRNLELYQRAFVHRSYTKRPDTENDAHRVRLVEQPSNCLPLSSKSNERLEFLGDGILELIVKFYLYRRFPKEQEGFMTEKKIAIVKNEAIGKIAMEMGLQKWLILSKHAEEKKIRGNLKKMGCLFEAFLGAVFLDFNHTTTASTTNTNSTIYNLTVPNPNIITTIHENSSNTNSGFEIARVFLENILEHHIDWTVLLCNDDNYKNILQVKIQREFKVTPTYKEIGESNLETGFCMGVYLCLGHEGTFVHLNHANAIPIVFFTCIKDIHTYIQHHGKIFVFLGNGQHKTKRKAEQFACKTALNQLYKINGF